MAILKKKSADAFVVPSLSDASPDYARQLAKLQELNDQQTELRAEKRRVDEAIRQARSVPGEHISASVAALLGDGEDSSVALRQELAELRRRGADLETAIEIQQRRIIDAKSPASALVVAASRDEYRRRVAAVAKAAADLHEARMSYLDLRWQFEAQDVSWTALGPISIAFLGDHTDGPLVTLSKEGGRNV